MAANVTPLSTRRLPAWSRDAYLRLLGWAFAFFGSVRVLSYLPTMLTIWQQGSSSQHSLLTWCTWLGANLTMALWLHENGDRRSRGAVWVSAGNAAMCAAIVALILVYR